MKNIAKKFAGVFLCMSFALLLNVFAPQQTLSAKAWWYQSVSSSSIKQTKATKTTLTFQWTPTKETAKYNIYYKDSKDSFNQYQKAGSTTGSSYTLKKLKSGIAYDVRVVPVSAAGEEGSYGSAYDLITLPSKINNLHQKKWWYWIEKVDIEWDKLSGVDGYEVSVYKSGKRIARKVLDQPYLNSFSFEVKNGNIYTVKVRAFTKFKNKKYYSSTAACYSIGQARITKTSVSNKKLVVKWSKVSGATGYDIYVSTKPKTGYKKVKSVSAKTTSATITKFNKKNISAKKTYYVYVKTKKKVGKKTYNSGALYTWNAKTNQTAYLD